MQQKCVRFINYFMVNEHYPFCSSCNAEYVIAKGSTAEHNGTLHYTDAERDEIDKMRAQISTRA